ncbi:RNA-binding protein [Leptolyngbya sp. BL0902]|uniref:KH domain-containing protein n=1 Tax=Leptolyngbya sp. BL0902 TaxID=1115757 RepID=UPI0018E88804|nr:KH domain-containing protein [Leptolyngbya sp. BL0902]QQE66663.1 RNA-binding protein [Leptolyngbya sp. BL0902]
MSSPDFSSLVKFLVEPFLDAPESLRIDCEQNAAQSKIWIRVAFSGDERGKVFGRGGRNIQAIRSVVRATATLWGWSAYFDVFGASEHEGAEGHRSERLHRSAPKPKPQRRTKPSLD